MKHLSNYLTNCCPVILQAKMSSIWRFAHAVCSKHQSRMCCGLDVDHETIITSKMSSHLPQATPAPCFPSATTQASSIISQGRTQDHQKDRLGHIGPRTQCSEWPLFASLQPLWSCLVRPDEEMPSICHWLDSSVLPAKHQTILLELRIWMLTMDPLVRNKHGCPQGVIKLHQRPNFHQILMRLDPCHCQEYLQRHRHHRKSLAIRRLNGWPTLHSMAGLNRTNLPQVSTPGDLDGADGSTVGGHGECWALKAEALCFECPALSMSSNCASVSTVKITACSHKKMEGMQHASDFLDDGRMRFWWDFEMSTSNVLPGPSRKQVKQVNLVWLLFIRLVRLSQN